MSTTFLAPLLGRGTWLRELTKLILIDKIITFALAGLPLYVFVHILYRVLQDWLWFTNNFHQSESTKSRGSLTSVSEAMADKTLREFSAPSTENIRTGPTLRTTNLEFEHKPSLINMVQATHSVERHVKMLVLIFRIFWRLAAQSSSRKLLKTSYYSACFHSL